MLKKIAQGCLIGFACSAIAVALWLAGGLERFEAKTWDWRVKRLAKPGPATGQIRLILIDQNSLDWAKQEMGLGWPWPREVYKPLLDFCRRQGAKAVAMDLVFTEPSSYGVADDEALGSAIATAPPFVSAVFLSRESGATNWPADIPPAGLEIKGLSSWLSNVNRDQSVFPRATFPIPEVATNACLLGNVAARPDPDAIFRRLPLFNVFDNRIVPLLGSAVFLAAAGEIEMEIMRDQLQMGKRNIPIDSDGNAILNFRGPSGTHRRFSAAAVIQSELRLQAGEEPTIKEADAFKDCYVLVGCTAPGLLDLRPAPVSSIYSGVELHATLLDNLLANDFIRKTSRTATMLLTLILGIMVGVTIRLGTTARANIISLVIFIPIPILVCLAAYQKGFWLPLMVQETSVVLGLVGGVLVNYATEGRQKRFIRNAFKQYISEEVVSQLVQHPERLSLGGEERELSIFFSDIEKFSGICEKFNPQVLTSFLNEYLTAMTDIIQEEGGTLDKYIGDAIVAFWNAPMPQADHAQRAVRAGLRCQAKLAQMGPGLSEKYGSTLRVRLGLNTGNVTVGNMGSQTRFNYTILGDAANLASRLEGLNKQFGTYTLLSETTRSQMGDDFAAREIGCVTVVGRKAPVRVYEPMLPAEYAGRRAEFEAFDRARQTFYEGRFSEAAACFEPLEKKDPPAAAYLRQARLFAAQPPQKWEGVWDVKEK